MSIQQIQQPAESTQPHLLLESRPARVIAAIYDQLPFPILAPLQETAFDLGITAYNGDYVLQGAVFKGYHEHQLLFEQRWPARILQAHSGEQDLTIEAGFGLALRSLHFQLHGYEKLTHIEVTIVAKLKHQSESSQALLQIPVSHHQSKTDLHFPLRGSWWAIEGSDWSDRHKQEVFSQTYAVDFVKLGANNRFFYGQGATLEDYYSWREPVYATAGGKIAYVAYDMPDMTPGQAPNPLMFHGDPGRMLGNAVAVSHGNGEFSYYAHLQQGSVQVAVGEMVKRGTLLGRVGNSGISPGPHLHFHLMEGPNLFIDQGLPLKFSHFWANGQFFKEPTYIPTRLIVHGEES
jgi:hypothetical protein